MTRTLARWLTLAVGVLAAAPALAQDLYLGYQAPLTGTQSQYGEVFRNAATMQLERFNAGGGVAGRKVQILWEDSKSDPKEAVAIGRKFVDDKRVLGVLGDFASGPSMAVAEVYAKEGVAQLSQTASHPDFVKISPWQFRNITTQAQEGPYNAAWLKEAGVKNVAVIALQNDWGISAAENFVKSFEGIGGKTSVEYFNPGSRDFRSILTKVSRGNPDAIYLAMFYEEGALLLQQAKQLAVKSQMFSTSALYAPKLLELGGDAINGLRLSTTFVPDNPAPQVKAFVDEYKRRFGQEPNQFAAQAFDAVGIMLEALKRAGPAATRAQLRDQLAATTNYPGVTGATTFDPKTREPSKSLARMEVKGGKFVVL
jgi:branched-chain amino acid transport system substrate-binding protein